MNLLRIITREEVIGGLDISDDALRLALLSSPPKEQSPRIQFLIEEPLETAIVANGMLIKKDDFIKALQKLLKKAPEKLKYAIVSIPPDQVYARVFSFPGTLRGQKLEESMKLTAGFQLPVQPKDVYLDWQNLEESEQSTVFLASLSRTIAKPFLDAITQAGLNTVALEYHPLSFSRIITLPHDETILLTSPSQSSFNIFILRNGVVEFGRTIPRAFAPSEDFSDEIRKVQDFYESRHGSISKVLAIDKAEVRAEFTQRPEVQKEPSKWIVSLGAAARGLIPRSHDSLISLMPIGTERAYEYQKALAFTGFLANVTIALSIFFTAVFVGAWIFMSSLQQRVSERIETLNTLPVPADAATLEERARYLNSLTGNAKAILDTTPRWSTVIGKALKEIPPGIVITNVALNSNGSPFQLSGIAVNRTQLTLFKKNVGESEFFTAVQVPATSLELKEKIPFTMSFQLKDPQTLFQ